MADRNIQTPHSIPSLIYVESNGEARGFKQNLVQEDITEIFKQFLVCQECKGVIRDAVQSKGRTVCQSCAIESSGDFDKNVQDNVPKLKCRCPLSKEGCSWSGELGAIREHLETCFNVLVECPTKCGVVMERGMVVEHQNDTCSLRLKQCEYCKQNVQSSRENIHARECHNNPDIIISCPYKEIGCNTKGILRKNLDEHLAENIIPHQQLLLAQFNDLQVKNEQLMRINADLRDRMNARSNMGKCYIILAILVAVVVVNILVMCQLEKDIMFEREKKQGLTSENIQELPTRLSSNFGGTESICSDEDKPRIDTVNLSEKLELKLEKSISKINDNITNIQKEFQKQLDERLPAISRYFKERNKILQGVEWTHEYIESDITIHGPKFYLGLCRLRIHAKFGYKNKKSGLTYYVTRLSGDYDGVVNRCHISYICHFYEHINGMKSSILEEEKDSDLEIEDQLFIQFFHYGFNFQRTQFIRNDKLTVKIYFETENT